MTESLSIWDDAELKSNDNYITFDKVGDGVSGKILSIKKHTFDDGKVVPQILILCDDGEERTMTAGQIRLKAALAERRPGVGDVISVKYTQEEKRSGGKTLKHFDVVIGGAAAPAAVSTPAAPPAEAPPAIDPQAAAAAIANLTPEQRAALGM